MLMLCYCYLQCKVNNAGAGYVKTIEQSTMKDVQWVMNVNFFGVVRYGYMHVVYACLYAHTHTKQLKQNKLLCYKLDSVINSNDMYIGMPLISCVCIIVCPCVLQ